MSFATSKYRPLFDASTELAGLPNWKSFPPGVWLEAICLTESSGNPLASHFDPGHDKGDVILAKGWTSYGLFQIEGVTAIAYLGLDHSAAFDWLFKPQINTAIAVGLLSASLQHYKGDVAKAIAAYNGGGWGAVVNVSTHELNDQAYVDRVEANARTILADRS